MSTKQKKTIQKGSFKRLLKLFFFKNKMLTALMLFSIIISAVFLLGRDIECDFSDPVRIEMAVRMVFHTDHL